MLTDMIDSFETQMMEFEKDPQFQAEYALMDVTERICKLYGQPKGIYRMLFWLLNWSADKLIWRKQTPKRKGGDKDGKSDNRL